MKIDALKSESEYEDALGRADIIFDVMSGTDLGKEFELLLLVIKDYEDRHHPILPPEKDISNNYSG